MQRSGIPSQKSRDDEIYTGFADGRASRALRAGNSTWAHSLGLKPDQARGSAGRGSRGC